MQETNVWFRSRSQSSAVKRTDKLGFPAGRGYLPEAEHHRTLASLCQKTDRDTCVLITCSSSSIQFTVVLSLLALMKHNLANICQCYLLTLLQNITKLTLSVDVLSGRDCRLSYFWRHMDITHYEAS